MQFSPRKALTFEKAPTYGRVWRLAPADGCAISTIW